MYNVKLFSIFANINSFSFSGLSPLFTASLRGDADIVEYLVRRTDVVSAKERGDSLDLLGSTYIEERDSTSNAVRYWKKAFDERYDLSTFNISV